MLPHLNEKRMVFIIKNMTALQVLVEEPLRGRVPGASWYEPMSNEHPPCVGIRNEKGMTTGVE